MGFQEVERGPHSPPPPKMSFANVIWTEWSIFATYGFWGLSSLSKHWGPLSTPIRYQLQGLLFPCFPQNKRCFFPIVLLWLLPLPQAARSSRDHSNKICCLEMREHWSHMVCLFICVYTCKIYLISPFISICLGEVDSSHPRHKPTGTIAYWFWKIKGTIQGSTLGRRYVLTLARITSSDTGHRPATNSQEHLPARCLWAPRLQGGSWKGRGWPALCCHPVLSVQWWWLLSWKKSPRTAIHPTRSLQTSHYLALLAQNCRMQPTYMVECSSIKKSLNTEN